MSTSVSSGVATAGFAVVDTATGVSIVRPLDSVTE
jgi:hypothetical protein